MVYITILAIKPEQKPSIFDDYDDQSLNYGDNQDDDGSFYLPLRPAIPSESAQVKFKIIFHFLILIRF